MSGPFKMKGYSLPGPNQSPLYAGKKTSLWGKVKSAAGALGDVVQQEFEDPAGHGSYDSTSHRFSRAYKKRKKESRKKQIKK